MKTRHSILTAALLLALAPDGAMALGLGPLQVKSGLNQPLVAEIPILSATPAELEALDVRLASPESFARVGLERPLELTANLQFSLGTNARGQPVVRVTTPNRFSEPFLSILIEADWGKGTVTREYTALIDPPYIAPAVIRPLTAPGVAVMPPPVALPPQPQPEPEPEPAQPLVVSEPEPVAPPPQPVPQTLPPPPPPQPVAAQPPRRMAPPISQPQPQPQPAAPRPAPQPVAPAPRPAPQPAPTPAPPAAQPGEYGPVSSGQTLWSIAESVRPDPSVTVNQVMLALQRANPDAFDQGNINRLKRGSVLRIPRQEEIATLSSAEAAVLVRQQAEAWRGARAPAPQPAEGVAAAPSPRATAPAAPRPSRPRSTARLEIAPPASATGARGAQSGAAAGAGGTELRAQLTQAREDLAARTAEVTELKSRVADLERMDKRSQEMIAVQDSRLKQLQERLRELEAERASAAAASPTPAPADVATPAPEVESTAAPGGGDLAAATAPEPVAAPPVAAAVAPEAAAATPAASNPEAPPAAPADKPIWMNPIVLGAGGLLLLLMVVLGLRRTRKKPAEVVIGGNGNRISDDDALRASLARTRANTTPAKADEAAKGAPVAAAVASKAAPDVETDAELDHARAAIRSRPSDLESHLGLLRLYHSRGNALEYEAAAQAMRMQVGAPTDPRWREAVVMGAALMPGHPLFSQAGWNAPRFGEEASGSAAPAKPKAVPFDESPPTVKSTRIAPPEPTVATPVPTPAPVPAPAPAPAPAPVPAPIAAAEELDIDAEWDKAMNEARGDTTDDEAIEFDAAPSDVHRNEAEVLAEDEASATRIELAKAYLDIGDLEGARSMLEEVFADGGPAAKAEAERILKEIG